MIEMQQKASMIPPESTQELSTSVYLVKSESRDATYEVNLETQTCTCSCFHWREMCKHLFACNSQFDGEDEDGTLDGEYGSVVEEATMEESATQAAIDEKRGEANKNVLGLQRFILKCQTDEGMAIKYCDKLKEMANIARSAIIEPSFGPHEYIAPNASNSGATIPSFIRVKLLGRPKRRKNALLDVMILK